MCVCSLGVCFHFWVASPSRGMNMDRLMCSCCCCCCCSCWFWQVVGCLVTRAIETWGQASKQTYLSYDGSSSTWTSLNDRDRLGLANLVGWRQGIGGREREAEEWKRAQYYKRLGSQINRLWSDMRIIKLENFISNVCTVHSVHCTHAECILLPSSRTSGQLKQ